MKPKGWLIRASKLEPLNACAQQVQRDMVEALVPTLDHVKIIHNLLDEKEIQIE